MDTITDKIMGMKNRSWQNDVSKGGCYYSERHA